MTSGLDRIAVLLTAEHLIYFPTGCFKRSCRYMPLSRPKRLFICYPTPSFRVFGLESLWTAILGHRRQRGILISFQRAMEGWMDG